MEKKEFKRILGDVLKEYGFKYIKKGYYCNNNELIVVVSTQKSNFADSYYLNYGFLIRELNPEIEYPKDYICDERGRFAFENNNKIRYEFYIGEDNEQILKHSIKEGVEKNIIPVLEKGLSEYYKIFPGTYACANLKTKEYLKLDCK